MTSNQNQQGASGKEAQVMHMNPRIEKERQMILDAEKKDLGSGPTLDLLTRTETEHGEPLEIIKALAPGSHGIDPGEFYL